MMIGLVATSPLASCKKENNTSNTNSNLNLDGISFKASTEGGNRNAKTYLDGEDIKWMAGDLILVQNSASPVQQAPFEVVEGIGSMNGTFYTGSTFDRSPNYVAAYPYDKVTISGTTATFSLPQQQQMTQTGTFGNGAMPMVAHTTTDQLDFYNVCGGICFPLQGAGKHVTKIVLTSKNTSDRLWGTFTANCTAVPTTGDLASGPMPTHVSGGSNSVELICNGTTGITLTAEPQDFYIMVPPQTMTTGFTVTAYDGDNVIYNQNITWDATTHANFIKRSVVSKVETPITISDPLTVTTISPTFISYDKAWMGGTVTGGTPTECGVIYATYDALSGNPDNLVMTGSNVYSVEMTPSGTAYNDWANELTKNTVYFVKAYAISASGETYYGEAIPFATRRDYEHDYQGKLQGGFSIANGDQRYFAMGNLQYKLSDATWYYADYQFEYVGWNEAPGNVYEGGEKPIASENGLRSDNTGIDVYRNPNDIDTPEEVNISNNSHNASYQGRIDWFAWGSSGYNHSGNTGTPFHQPYCRIKHYTPLAEEYYEGYYIGQPYRYFNNFYGPNDTHYYIGGSSTTNLSVENGADWAINTIENGSASGKRTISGDNWNYLLYQRTASTVNSIANARFSFAALNVRNNQSINGIFLFPDNFTWPELVTHYPSHINNIAVNHWLDVASFTEAEWSLLEHENLVFLPASGCYGKTGHAEWSNRGGRYWTSTVVAPSATTTGGAYDFAFSPEHVSGEGIVNGKALDHKFYGFAVRFMIP